MANLKDLIVNGASRFIGKVFINDSQITKINGSTVGQNPKFTDTNTTYSAGTGLTASGTTINHAASITAASVGPSADISGSTAAVPYITYNATGHITAASTKKYTVGSLAASAITSGTFATSILPTIPIAKGGTGNTTGNAASATKLANARTIRTNLASTATASFNGTANVTPGVQGVLPIANGGTGSSTAAAARTALGLGSAAVATTSASVGNNTNLPTGAAIQSYVTGLGYEANQNAFTTVKVGTTDLVADTKTDTLTITAGNNITLTPTASSDSFSIAATNTTYSTATTAANGLMSKDDKVTLEKLINSSCYFGTCETDTDVSTKIVICPSYKSLTEGSSIVVYFTHSQYGSATLNVNNTGAKSIKLTGSNDVPSWSWGTTHRFVYYDNCWYMESDTGYYRFPSHDFSSLRALCFGDSNTMETPPSGYGNIFSTLCSWLGVKSYKSYGISGATIQRGTSTSSVVIDQLTTAAAAESGTEVGLVLFLAGINDFHYETFDVGSFGSAVRETVQAIHAQYPHALIITCMDCGSQLPNGNLLLYNETMKRNSIIVGSELHTCFVPIVDMCLQSNLWYNANHYSQTGAYAVAARILNSIFGCGQGYTPAPKYTESNYTSSNVAINGAYNFTAQTLTTIDPWNLIRRDKTHILTRTNFNSGNITGGSTGAALVRVPGMFYPNKRGGFPTEASYGPMFMIKNAGGSFINCCQLVNYKATISSSYVSASYDSQIEIRLPYLSGETWTNARGFLDFETTITILDTD